MLISARRNAVTPEPSPLEVLKARSDDLMAEIDRLTGAPDGYEKDAGAVGTQPAPSGKR